MPIVIFSSSKISSQSTRSVPFPLIVSTSCCSVLFHVPSSGFPVNILNKKNAPIKIISTLAVDMTILHAILRFSSLLFAINILPLPSLQVIEVSPTVI